MSGSEPECLNIFRLFAPAGRVVSNVPSTAIAVVTADNEGAAVGMTEPIPIIPTLDNPLFLAGLTALLEHYPSKPTEPDKDRDRFTSLLPIDNSSKSKTSVNKPSVLSESEII